MAGSGRVLALCLTLHGCAQQAPARGSAAPYPAGDPTHAAPSRVRAPTPEQLVLSYLGDRRQTVREAPHVVICMPGWEGRPREGGVRTPQRVIAKSFTVDTTCRVPPFTAGDTLDGVLLVRYSFEPDTARVSATHIQTRWPQSWSEEYVWSNLRPVQNWSLRIWGFNPVND